MYDPSKSIPLESQSTYEVRGEDLMQLNNLLGDVFSSLSWLQRNISDNLSFLASGCDDGFVRFVAKVGMQLQTLNEIVAKCKSWKLNGPCYHLALEKLNRDKVSGEDSDVVRNCNRFETADEAWSYWKDMVATSDDNKAKNMDFNRWLFDVYRRPESGQSNVAKA